MVSDKRMIARRVAIGYVVVGIVYFLLWHFAISPAGYTHPFLEVLFYISLPAILGAPYFICELLSQAFNPDEEPSEVTDF
jgi:hypothetical protein